MWPYRRQPSINQNFPPLPKTPADQDKNACFVSIDFETADYGRDSACSIAMVKVEGDRIVDRTHFFIRPPRRNFVFSYLHGITWERVAQEPTFAEVWPWVAGKLEGAAFIAAHNASFDQSVLITCCRAAGLPPPAIPFQCTVQLARRVWRIRPTNLPNVCAFLGIPLKHHDAASDAEACARIVMAARDLIA